MGPARLVAAVDVGGTSIKGALADTDGGLSHAGRRAVSDVPAGDLVPAILDMTNDLVCAAARAGTPAQAVGLAVPGVVDEATGVSEYSMILGWKDVPFARLLGDRFALPVAFGHDVSAGAYAEARRGAARGHLDWLFLALGTGLGSTFLLDDRPYRGSGGTGGELAHVVCEVNGPLCRCGKRGCVEMVSSAAAVADLYREASGRIGVGADEVAALARDGDPTAAAVWARAVAGLATVVAGYVESMNPSAVILGGGLSGAGEALLAPFVEQLRRHVAFARSFPIVRLAHFGDLAALHGIAQCALELAADPHHAMYASPFAATASTVQVGQQRSRRPDPTREAQLQ